MPGFQQTQLNNSARNANTVTVLIGDQPIAFAQSVSHSFDMGAEAFYGVGNAKPQEIQQLKMSPQITVDQFNLTSQGQSRIQGNNLTLSSLLANNEFNLHIIDGQSGQSLFTYVGCVATNFNQNVPSNQVITDAISFLARDVLDQTGLSILDGPNAFTV